MPAFGGVEQAASSRRARSPPCTCGRRRRPKAPSDNKNVGSLMPRFTDELQQVLFAVDLHGDAVHRRQNRVVPCVSPPESRGKRRCTDSHRMHLLKSMENGCLICQIALTGQDLAHLGSLYRARDRSDALELQPPAGRLSRMCTSYSLRKLLIVHSRRKPRSYRARTAPSP